MSLNVSAGSWAYTGNGNIKISLNSTDLGLPRTGRSSKVWASVVELARNPGDADMPLVGDAFLNVGGIAPHDDGTIDVHVHVDWDSPLLFELTVFVAA